MSRLAMIITLATGATCFLLLHYWREIVNLMPLAE